MKRHLRRAAWILVVLLLLGVVVWTAGNLIGSSRYESAVAELEADGYVLDAGRLGPAPVPAAENSAPFYSAAFALYVEPESGAEYPHKPLRELDPEARAAAAAWLGRNAEAFDMIRRARKRPRCRFERDYSLGYTMPLPEIAKAIALGRALGALAEKQAADGDGAASRESVQLMVALAESLREDPILVSFLVRMVVVETALVVMDEVISDRTKEEELREWKSVLPDDAFLKGNTERALRGEIAMAMSFLNNPTGDMWALVGKQAHWLQWDLLRPIVRYDSADYLYDMRRLVLASRKPYLQAAADAEELRHSFLGARTNPVRAMLMPALSKCLERQASAEARLLVVRAGLEAELVRRTTGAYPKEVPGIDPFSGKPLIVDLENGRIASVRPTESPSDEPTEWRLRAKK
jgi:hypothetical protein